jgi:hypothetical protein
MKFKFLLCLALVLSGGLFGWPNVGSCQTNSDVQWVTFTDAARHFHFQHPATWKINTDVVPVMHYRDVFVSLNSAHRHTVGDLQVSTNTWEYGTPTTIEQLAIGMVRGLVLARTSGKWRLRICQVCSRRMMKKSRTA